MTTPAEIEEAVKFLKAHAGDLAYWRGLDIESVNYYTSGTPYFNNFEEMDEYIAELDKALADLSGGVK